MSQKAYDYFMSFINMKRFGMSDEKLKSGIAAFLTSETIERVVVYIQNSRFILH